MMSPRPNSDDRGSSNFSNTFYLLLFGALIHPIFAAAKALEGQTALEYAELYWQSILVLFLEYYLQYCMDGGAMYGKSLDAELRTEQVLGMKEMVVPLLAGILSALRRVIARRVSLKGSKSSSSVDLPFSAWAFLSTTLFGIILIFYVDAMAEERLHMVFSSPRHLMVAGGCIIVMEMVYKMDFSLIGFIICSLILGFGIYEATSLDHGRKDTFQKPDLSNGMLGDELQMYYLM
ncbi:hypothetical protein CUMW_078150 [Citrus unshiu]|nr:hypothetical protein CUMW_078150 [Citrus unshiu]